MIDRYTKIVLTIIAVSLSALAAQNGMRMAWAIDYNEACGTVGHPPCHVVWSQALPVRIQ